MPNTDVLRGAYCPLIVPFRNQKIDYDTYGKLIERQIAEGTHGLLVNFQVDLFRSAISGPSRVIETT
jgi:hypothetical protein